MARTERGAPMASMVRGAALLLAVACLVWVGVLWRWQAARHRMDAGDIVLYLAVLPVVVFALVLAARWAVVGALARQDARTAGAAPEAAGDALVAGPDAAAPAAAGLAEADWHLLGAWTHTAAGTDPDGLMAAAASGWPRPVPDGQLRDDEGLPVMTARAANLTAQALEAELRGDRDPSAADPFEPLPERAIRALSSLAIPLEELVSALTDRAARWHGGADAEGGHPAPAVRMLAAWPTDWSDAACAAAQAWLERRMCGPLAEWLPPARWSIEGRRMSGGELLAAAGRMLETLRLQARDDPVVLVACHSDLDEAALRTLADRGALFHAERRPKLPMAGEGAAVLALAARAWPSSVDDGALAVRLSPPVLLRRATSIDAPGRTATAETVRLVERCLAAAGVQGAVIAALASDADRHTARATELFAVTLALLPGLDALEDVRLAGAVTGRLEAAAPLIALALAAAQVRETGRPAVALSLADPHGRMAAVLRPHRPGADPGAAR
jgi:hypothetical protein